MDTQIVKRLSLSEAGQLADHVAAKSVFDRELATLSENTRRARRADLATWATYLDAAQVDVTGCDFYGSPLCWAGVTSGLVSGFVQWMLKNGYAINAVNRKLSTVKVFCAMAAKAKVLDAGELALIQSIKQYQHGQGFELDKQRTVKRIGAKKSVAVDLDSDQAQKLKALPGDTPQAKRDRLMLCLMLDQALRVSEIVILNVADFNIKRRTFTFYRPKVKATETHRLTNATADALIDYLEADGAPEIGRLIVGTTQHGALTGEPMSERAVTKRVNWLGEEYLGIDNLSAHDLRHSAATRAARGGTGVNALMGLGGWTSAATAMRYVNKQKIANDGVKFEE